jgi:DNA repair protein RecO (recombination protein O)
LSEVARSVKTPAVVLRSLRLGEADRVLHLYTLDRGRVGAVAKGIRKTTSRFGARLEPLSLVDLMLHQGSGELLTVTGVELVRSHRQTREDVYRLNAGLVCAEAMLRLFGEPEANPKAFEALTKFLDALDDAEPGRASKPQHDPLVIAFQLKLLWLAGYLPHLGSCAECGAPPPFAGYSARAGGVVCPGCAGHALPLSAAGLQAMDGLLRRPLAESHAGELGERAARECLAVIRASYEEHGGFRLKTLSA